MEKHHLSQRDNWQAKASEGAVLAEKTFANTVRNYLDEKYPGQWIVTPKPQDLRQIYYEYTYQRNPERYVKPESPTESNVWFCDSLKQFRTLKREFALGGGCEIDCKIEHTRSGKKIFIEVKNQGPAGNAHERAAKYATPSVISHVQNKFNISYNPFAYIFTGEMVDRLDYRIELETTYGFAEDYLFLWSKEHPLEPLTQWLESVILPKLSAAS
jgi:hypothetical protein